MERSILYVSRQSPFTLDRDQAIHDIVAKARLYNTQRGITGALACTHNYFAQLLEGPSAELYDLVHRLEEDDRHCEVTILRDESVSNRCLTGWSMAYSGPSTYVARQIEPLIGEINATNYLRVQRLLSLLVGLATPEPILR